MHVGMAGDLQVGSPQLRFLQDLLQSCDGVFGARFSGAGTRGACVALVHADATEQVAAKASHRLLAVPVVGDREQNAYS